MLLRGVYLLAVLCLVAGDAVAAEPEASRAAEVYRQAFGILPQQGTEDYRTLENASDAPRSPATIALLEKDAKVFGLLHEAAAFPKCDWGIDFEHGRIGLKLPHLAAARDLSELAWVRIRNAYSQNNSSDAIQVGADMLAFSRHIGSAPVQVAKMVEAGLVAGTVEYTATGLKSASGPALRYLAFRIDHLPPSVSLADAIKTDDRYLLEWLDALAKLKPADVVADDGPLMPLLKGNPNAPAIKVLWLDDQRRAAGIAEVTALSQEGLRIVTLPHAQAEEAFDPFENKVRAASALAQGVLPKYRGLRHRDDIRQALTALLRAAIELCQNPDVPPTTKDPVTGQAFEIHKLADGFELQSSLKLKNQPVTLKVGQ